MQDFEAEVRQQLKRPQAAVHAQVAAAQVDWDMAHGSDTFDHKLVSFGTNQKHMLLHGIMLAKHVAVFELKPTVQFHQQTRLCVSV